MSNDKVKRRRLLQSMGAASGVALGSAAVTAAEDLFENISPSDIEHLESVLKDVEELSGPEGRQTIARARRSEEFRRLHKIVRQNHAVRSGTSTAYRSEALGSDFVIFEFEGANTDQTGIIGIEVSNPELEPDEEFSGAKLPTKAVVKSYEGDALTAVDQYQLEASINASTPPEGVTINRIDTGDATVVHIHADYDEAFPDTSKLHTSTNGFLGTASAQTVSGEYCDECKLVVGAINATTCGLSTYIGCSVITAKTIVGPVACAIILPPACFIITNYGTSDPDDVCRGRDAIGNEVSGVDMPCD